MDTLAATHVSLGLAFLAGILSLISPCVLALVPVYLAYISGVTAGEAGAAGERRAPVLLHALLFVSGFTLLFVLFGASASLLGQLLLINQRLIGQVAGVVVAAFGLHTLGLLRIPWLDRQVKWTYKGGSGRPHHSFFIGMAFAAGWTPCVGPILGAILALASVGDTLWDGVGLLFAYALGMGLPFLAIAATVDRSRRLIQAIGRRHRLVETASGILLIIIGIMLYTDTFSFLARYANYFNLL